MQTYLLEPSKRVLARWFRPESSVGLMMSRIEATDDASAIAEAKARYAAMGPDADFANLCGMDGVSLWTSEFA